MAGRRWPRSARILLRVAIAFAILEGGLRLSSKGGPWRVPVFDKQIEGDAWTVPDELLGFRYGPGTFTIRSRAGPAIRYTHTSAGRRISRPPGTPRPKGKAIWFMGCSYTYGWGVKDDETFPWLIQRALPNREVVNFGVNGYGTVHSLLQLEQALAQGPPPALVVLGHGVFHDKRNVVSRRYRKRTRSHHQVVYTVPYATLDDDRLVISYRPLTYEPWPGQRTFALVHTAERIRNRVGEWLHGPDGVAKALLARMAAACSEKGVLFVVAGIDRRHLPERLDWIREQEIIAVDISVDLADPGWRNASDGHPSARAHKAFADRLLAFLREKRLVK